MKNSNCHHSDTPLLRFDSDKKPIYPNGCTGLFEALSAFESRRSNELAAKIEAERAENYELAKGTEQRDKPAFVNGSTKIYRKNLQTGETELIKVDEMPKVEVGKISIGNSTKPVMPPPDELKQMWRKAGCQINNLKRLYGINYMTAKSWLMKAGLIPSRTYGKEAK